MNQIKKVYSELFAKNYLFGFMLLCFLLFATIQQSMAAVPAAVSTGITDAVADVGTIGGLVMGVIIAIVAFVWLKRVLSGR